CEVQIKIDSGLGRYGFLPTETDKIASIFKYMPNLAVIGVFSTYSQSHKSERITRSEYETFKGVLDKLTQMGFEVGYTHIADSAALFKYDFGTMDAVRVGTALAGRVAGGAVPGLMKVGYIKAGVEEVGWFPKKHRIGGQTLKKPARLAVLSVGFYNGFGVNRPDYERRLIDILKARKRRPVVKLGGRKLRIIGNVGLQHTIVDVTDIECSVGDACYLDVDPVNVKGLQRTYISHEEK
ncbi:MAG: alanine racemase, partial [Oscillospiraceae bacterium]|nr:alanine racemase [Oscillospiraceae bacterium]